jgi:hypothetical protein
VEPILVKKLIAFPPVVKIYLILLGRVARRVPILRRAFLMMTTKETIKTEVKSIEFLFGKARLAKESGELIPVKKLKAYPRVIEIYLILLGRVARRVIILRRDFLMMKTKEIIKTEAICTEFHLRKEG